MKIQATFFIWCPATEAVIVDAQEILGSFTLPGTVLVSHIASSFRDFQCPLPIPSLPFSFSFLFFSPHAFFFFCALFLPCIPPFKFHWCSGSDPSQTGKPLFVLECPLPQILCLHMVPWMLSLAGLALIFPYFPFFPSSNQKVLFCCIFSGSTIC